MRHGGKTIKPLALPSNAFSHHPPRQSRQGHAVTGVALCVIYVTAKTAEIGCAIKCNGHIATPAIINAHPLEMGKKLRDLGIHAPLQSARFASIVADLPTVDQPLVSRKSIIVQHEIGI